MQEVETQTVVAGAGIIGMAVALELARAGRVVHVVEREMVAGAAASGAAAGILAPRYDAEGPGALLDLFIKSWSLWPGLARDLLQLSGIDPQYRSEGLLHLAADRNEWEAFRKRVAWQESVGMRVEALDSSEVHERFPMVTGDTAGTLFYPHEHHLHTSRTLEACYVACRNSGVYFIFGEPVEELITAPSGGGRRITALRTGGCRIEAENAVLATGAWTGELLATAGYRLPVEPVRGQAAVARVGEQAPPCLLYSSRAYIVPREGGEIFAGTTLERVGFDRTTTEEGIKTVWNGARWILPNLEEKPPSERWAGLRPGTADDLPILGPVPGIANLWIATGHYRNGFLLAPVTGEMMCRWIESGDPGRDLSPFLPDRFL